MDTEPLSQLSQLSIAQLTAFARVVDHGGYAAAAKVLGVSVPSVWHQVRALEKAYGVDLFDRAGRQVVPTDAARRLHVQVEQVLVRLGSTLEVVKGPEPDTPIRFVTGARMMLEDLAAPLAMFKKQHPNRLVIRHGNDRRAEALILSDGADLATALEPGPGQASERIRYEPAYTVEFLAVARKSHPYMKCGSSSLRELAKHELIVTAAGTHGRDALDQAFARERLTARVAAETDNSAFTIACVSAGMGVGILAGRPTGGLTRKLATRSLSRPLGQRRIVLMWRQGRVLSDPMVSLIENIKKIDG